MTSLRVLSWNLGSSGHRTAAIGRVIRDANPDVVCLQGAPRFARWRSRRAALARASGLVVVGGPRADGVAVLTAVRVGVRATADVRLSPTPGRPRRALALAGLELAGARFGVVSLSLGLDVVDRLRHVPEIARAVERLAGQPVILAGEVNEEPGGPAYRALAARWPRTLVPEPTAAQELGATTSAVLAGPPIVVREVRALDGLDGARGRSRPLLAVLELPTPVATPVATAT